MKSRFLIFIAAIALSSCCSTHSTRHSYLSLDVEAFAKYISNDKVLLVDVRSPKEHSEGHIAGTDINLDVRSATFFTDYKSLPNDRPIALYCKAGGRSKQVAGVLAGNGYKVVELTVGYDGWVKSGKESTSK